MKNKNLMIILGMIFLLAVMQNVSGEIYLWNSVIKSNATNTVNYHAYYQYQDTSAKGIGANQDTAITFWYIVEPLPYILAFGQVDYCNFTISHFKNVYDSLGNVINTSTETTSYDFVTGGLNSSQVVFLLRNRDSLIADMKCHYTDSQSLYQENVLVGSFTTYMSSYQCAECSDYSLEELSNMAQKNENITASQLSVYGSIQKVVDFNYQAWLIVSWIIKIGLVFVAVGLVFAGVYYFYVFFSNIGKELSR